MRSYPLLCSEILRISIWSIIASPWFRCSRSILHRDASIPAARLYVWPATAVHWPKDEQFEIVYILYSFEKNEHLRVKARIKEWEPIESVVSIWTTADWLEREVYDMFGVQYANHPNLKRILLPEDWVGFPLRKDYNIRLQDVEWVRKHLGIESGQKYYVGEARHESPDYRTPQD